MFRVTAVSCNPHCYAGQQVQICQYTVHVFDPVLEQKMPGFVLRRGPRCHSLLVFLFLNESILDVSSSALTELLAGEHMKMPKNATKAAKIRKLMTAASVMESTDESLRQKIEALLVQRDEAKKKSKKGKQAEDDNEEMCEEGCY